MKRGLSVFVFILVIFLLSLSLVSALSFKEILDKITGYAVRSSTYSCTDSDKGLDYYTKGEITYGRSNKTITRPDKCSKNKLTEHYCGKNGGPKVSTIQCKRGCENEACKYVTLTYENIEEELSKNEILKSIPKGSVILLKFYNFNSGEREWEKSYILKKSSVKEGKIENPDATMTIKSKYLGEIRDEIFCDVIKKASKVGDVGLYSDLPKFKLFVKLRNLLRYQKCILKVNLPGEGA